MIKKTITLNLLGLLFNFSPVQAQTRSANHSPNIIVILADDFGWGSLNSYGAPETLIKTPHIDRLAQEGRRFTDANTTSSVCTPSRYSVLTGRYCWRSSLKFETLDPNAPLLIEPERLTIPSLLKSQGYETAAIGKWHLGFGKEKKVDFRDLLSPGPLEIGFDYYFGIPQNHGDNTGVYVEDHSVYGLRSRNFIDAGTSPYGRKYIGIDAPQRTDKEVMSVLTEKATAWLKKQTPEKPFFLYYAPAAVHFPITPSDKNAGTSGCGLYGDFIHDLDQSVGTLLDLLDKSNLSQNTIVLFTSDNGGVLRTSGKSDEAKAYAMGLHVNGDFKNGKHSIYQGGSRVPYIVRWPGKVPAGTLCDEPVSLVDTLATVSNLLHVPLSDPSKGAEDSFNVLPAWMGTPYTPPLATLPDSS
ncbi:MAG: arylsulfatase [Verrucomicrobiota bacterium]